MKPTYLALQPNKRLKSISTFTALTLGWTRNEFLNAEFSQRVICNSPLGLNALCGSKCPACKKRKLLEWCFFSQWHRPRQEENRNSEFKIYDDLLQWRSRGMVLGVQHHLSDLMLVWDLNSYINRILHHFLTECFLNETIIKIITCNYDWWEGVWGEVICHKKFQQSFLNQSLTKPPSNQKLLDLPLLLVSGEDKTWTRGPWTPTLDQFHGPLSWTRSMDPLSWTGSMDSFF